MQQPQLYFVFYFIFIIKIVIMKKYVLAALAVITILAGYSQSEDNSRETRKVTGFQGVRVSGGIDLYISSGSESVSVSAANSNIRNHMVTEVINGILSIHLEKNWSPDEGSPKMKAYVSITTLKYLEASGGGDIYIQQEITAGDLNVRLSGGGNLKGKLRADHLDIKQSGGSNVDLTGNVKNLAVEASGGGNLKGYDLVTDFASILASGGSDTEITVNKELRVVTSGGSGVRYKGSASVVSVSSSGGGSLSHKD
jgi:Putative auto-transporter adhesin, head GIN domain